MGNIKNLTVVSVLIMVALLSFPFISGSDWFDAEFASTERITGVQTFFTRLHPGAINFLDGKITKWLKENPGVVIIQTNATIGVVDDGHKKEPNIIINIWY